ncbi:MAG: symmetrical bis(5'-nucleosyl)-tetraphosphatase [Steroidobacteraceae bacterium]|nr:symmetrical bis(5'-nucleosyl)-tetraphosphatase [Steroidobacteraceae bacterium]
MALYAIGDVQGCDRELAALLDRLDFSCERDHVWFVGDLVNRGPDSLGVLRRIRGLGESAITVLGNHDLHLLAVAFGKARERDGDTLQALLQARDRGPLIDWLLSRPLLHRDARRNRLLLHAGLAPQWTPDLATSCARELEQALQRSPEGVFEGMYGDGPEHWTAELEGAERWRFIANCLTRLRYVDARGRLALREKAAPDKARSAQLIPWFEAADAAWHGPKIVFGHWSALGFFRNAEVIGLDTGCVWGGRLTALRLDLEEAAPISVGCAQASGETAGDYPPGSARRISPRRK